MKKVKLEEIAARYPEAAERLRGEYFGKLRLTGTEIVVMNLAGSTTTFDFQNDDAWLPTTLRNGIARVLPKAQALKIVNGEKEETFKVKAGSRFALQREKETKRLYLEEVVAN